MSNDVVEIKLSTIFFDIILFNIVSWPNFLIDLWATPFKRGLFCDDESIRYPVKDSTVSFFSLVIIGFGLNAFTMLTTEYIKRKKNRNVIIVGKKFPYWIYNFIRSFGTFCFGDMLLWGTTDTIKHLTGRLRPHFYLGCLPNVCLTRYTPNEYFVDFICINPDVKDLRLSFPSGHSSFYMYTMTYFVIYLQKRMTWQGSKLLKHVLQYIAILSACCVGLSRVSDYKHHWSDVVTGIIIGGTIAIIVSLFFSDLFTKKSFKGKNNTENETDCCEVTMISDKSGSRHCPAEYKTCCNDLK